MNFRRKFWSLVKFSIFINKMRMTVANLKKKCPKWLYDASKILIWKGCSSLLYKLLMYVIYNFWYIVLYTTKDNALTYCYISGLYIGSHHLTKQHSRQNQDCMIVTKQSSMSSSKNHQILRQIFFESQRSHNHQAPLNKTT